MPLLFQRTINDDTSLAVWHILEDEEFYRCRAVPQRAVSHPHKRLQHLAGRYLLRHLAPNFPMELIRIAETRKPFLEDEAYHFSISHCSDYAAAIISRHSRVGVDIEVVTEKAVRIRHKFASDAEWAGVLAAWGSVHAGSAALDALVATLIWSCKEAVFKWYGAGEVDFKEHIQIGQCAADGAGRMVMQVVFQKEEPEALEVHSRLLDGVWLSYVVG
ncbi:4'-phosphopantetheinyl transferase family protein [Pseudocnuella soli]|uniref:4'-phosphopantetheinyl transferase family protein n=1 Tax=Pseudocnuella soli TaxID=2502779 RepID=UPI00104573BC|nr:4'-phosphopantetheinyl transferase superfamily protein [Pseudocnuella soli]